MSFLVDVPVDGGRLLVQAGEAELPGDLELAARQPGEVVAQARQSLEASLDQLRPAVRALSDKLRAMSPDEFSVEFGLVLGAEYGLVVAKGSGEVHFTVTLSWSSGRSARDHTGAPAGGHGDASSPNGDAASLKGGGDGSGSPGQD